MKRISVIIPDLHSPVIGKTLDALGKQNFPCEDYEVIVVGKDRHDIVSKIDWVRFDHTDQVLSPAESRNRGTEQSQGEILVFLDADCIPGINWLKILEARFTDPNVNVVGGGVEFHQSGYWVLVDNISIFHEHLSYLEPGRRDLLPSLNLAIRREVFESIGGFDETPRPFGEDSDLSIRLRLLGEMLFFEPKASVIHSPIRNHPAELMKRSFNQGKYSTKVEKKYAKEYGLPGIFHTRLGLIIFAPFLAAGATYRIFSKGETFRRYWHAIPAVFLAKTIWCLGASRHP